MLGRAVAAAADAADLLLLQSFVYNLIGLILFGESWIKEYKGLYTSLSACQGNAPVAAITAARGPWEAACSSGKLCLTDGPLLPKVRGHRLPHRSPDHHQILGLRFSSKGSEMV